MRHLPELFNRSGRSLMWTEPSRAPQIKRKLKRRSCLFVCLLLSCCAGKLIYPVASCYCRHHYGHSSLTFEPSSFGFPMWTDHWLCRNVPGLQAQTGTAETSSLMGLGKHWFSTSPVWRQPLLNYTKHIPKSIY